MTTSPSPGLYIVATPIGNLSDMTPRAAELLKSADVVLCEDKRVTAKLMHHIGAHTPLRRYDDHSSDGDRESILAMLGDKAVALVSDAGTPLISDPGYKLVRAARAGGYDVHTLPGPSAAIAALTLSGLPTDRFLFAGFLPPKQKARRDAIAELAAVKASLVLYESGPRLGACLADLAELLPGRDGAVSREITKLHEETGTGTLAELAERYAGGGPKGEIVIVIGPPPSPEAASDDALDAAIDLALKEMSPSRAAAKVAGDLNVPRKRAYARALERAKS